MGSALKFLQLWMLLGYLAWHTVADRGGGSHRVCSNYWCITIFSLPGKVCARVFQEKFQGFVKLHIQEELCRFHHGSGQTVDKLYKRRGLWSLSVLSIFALGPWRRLMTCVP